MTIVSQQDIDLMVTQLTSECATSFPGFFHHHPTTLAVTLSGGEMKHHWNEVGECVEAVRVFTFIVCVSRFALQALVETPTTVRSMPGLVGLGAQHKELVGGKAATVTTIQASSTRLGQTTATVSQAPVVRGSTTTGTGVSCIYTQLSVDEILTLKENLLKS